MPTYDLQFEGADCGNVLISNGPGNPPPAVIKYQNPPGPPTDIPGATCSAANPSNPQPGDVLNLNNFATSGHTFSGDAVFQNQNGPQRKGYYRTTANPQYPRKVEGDGDWDAADSGGGIS